MNFFRKIVCLIGLMLIGSFGFSLNANANEIGFAVEPIFPKNQIDISSGYFHLLMPKGEKQVIQLKLKNSKDEKVILNAWSTSATTNINGVVDYSDQKNEVDKSLQYNFKELINMEKEMELPPNSEKIVDIEVNMPNVNFEGVLAGGLTFEEQKASRGQNVSSQTGINNKFSYVIALIIQQENQILLDPELNLEKVEATQLNGKNAISAKIRNVTSVFLNQMSMAVSIKEKNSDKIVYTSSKEMMQMAPNSVVNFPVFLNGQKLEAGNYTYEAKITGYSNDQEEDELEWDLVSDFIIKKDEAKALNKTDTELMENKPHNLLVIGLMIGNLVLIIIIVTVVIFNRNKKKKLAKKARRKKKKH